MRAFQDYVECFPISSIFLVEILLVSRSTVNVLTMLGKRIGDQLSERWKTVLKMAEVSSDVYANTVERNETNDICDRVVTVIREKKKRSRIVNRVARVISVTLHFHIICTLPAFYPRYILYICYYIRKKYVYTGCS